MPNLEFKNKEIETLNKTFMLQDVKFKDEKKYKTEIEEAYPEESLNKKKRIASCMAEMTNDFEEQAHPMEAYIVVSHMWFHAIFKTGPQKGSGGDYCSVSAAKFETDKEKEIIMHACNDHLTQLN